MDDHLPIIGAKPKEKTLDDYAQTVVPPKENAALRQAIVDFNTKNAQALALTVNALDYLASALEARKEALKAKEHQDKKAEWAARAAGVNPAKVRHFDVDKALVYFEKE